MAIVKVTPAKVTPKVANAIVKIAGNAASNVKVVTANVVSSANLKIVANTLVAANVKLGFSVTPAPVTPKVANAIVKIGGNIASNIKVVTSNVITGKPTVITANLKAVVNAIKAAPVVAVTKALAVVVKKK